MNRVRRPQSLWNCPNSCLPACYGRGEWPEELSPALMSFSKGLLPRGRRKYPWPPSTPAAIFIPDAGLLESSHAWTSQSWTQSPWILEFWEARVHSAALGQDGAVGGVPKCRVLMWDGWRENCRMASSTGVRCWTDPLVVHSQFFNTERKMFPVISSTFSVSEGYCHHLVPLPHLYFGGVLWGLSSP